MDSWDDLAASVEAYTDGLLAGDRRGDFIVFAGGWHVWVEVSDTYSREDDSVVGRTFELAAAAVPPAEPSGGQRARLEAVGWRYDPAGPGFERALHTGLDGASKELAAAVTATLGEQLEVALDQPQVGPTSLWGSLPGVSAPTDDEVAAIREFRAKLHESGVRREARRERSRPHEEASEQLRARALELRDQRRAERIAAVEADDPHGLRFYRAMEALADAAERAALARRSDPRLQQPVESMLRRVLDDELDGAWEERLELFEHSERAEDAKVEGRREWLAEWKAEFAFWEAPYPGDDVVQEALSEPEGSGTAKAVEPLRRDIAFVAVAGPREQLLEALSVGAVSLGDVEFALLGYPRGWHSIIGEYRRQLIRAARQVAVVTEGGKGSYSPPSCW